MRCRIIHSTAKSTATGKDTVRTDAWPTRLFRAAGSDSRILYTGEGTSSVTTVVGDREYTTQEGKTTWKKLSDTERLAPFARSAADVVRAASKDPQVRSIGQEEVRGVKAAHYRVTLSADGDPQC